MCVFNNPSNDPKPDILPHQCLRCTENDPPTQIISGQQIVHSYRWTTVTNNPTKHTYKVSDKPTILCKLGTEFSSTHST